MPYTLKHLSKALKMLVEEGIKGIIIGSTSLDLALNKKTFEGDVDLFTTTISPILDSERIYSISARRGWENGVTEIGTPSIIINFNGAEISVELFENVMDFYIPSEALELCKQRLSYEGTEIEYVAVECWVVFKARRGASQDLAAISLVKELVEKGELELNLELMKKVVELYEEDSYYILDRLRGLGFAL